MNPASFSLVTPNQITTSQISKLPQVIFLKLDQPSTISLFNSFLIRKFMFCKLHDRKLLAYKLRHSILLSCKLHDRNCYRVICIIANSYLANCTIVNLFLASVTLRSSCLANYTIGTSYLANSTIRNWYLSNCTKA